MGTAPRQHSRCVFVASGWRNPSPGEDPELHDDEVHHGQDDRGGRCVDLGRQAEKLVEGDDRARHTRNSTNRDHEPGEAGAVRRIGLKAVSNNART